MRSGRIKAFTLTFNSSCSNRIAFPTVPKDLKGRRAVFGYLIDDAVQRNYYHELELEEDMTSEDYRNKYSIVRDAARMSNCRTEIMWMINPYWYGY